MNSVPYEDKPRMQPGSQKYAEPPAAGVYNTGPLSATRIKSPALAMWLSSMPGLGQIYVGYYQQGFINIVVVASVITMLNAQSLRGMHPFLGVFLAFYWLFNMIDASRRAHHYNRVAEGLGAEDVPEDFKLPSAGGSLFGGVVLVVIGVLFILDLNFGVSLAWIQDWWPLVLVAFGGNLIYKARQKAE